jgi:hypothetical protein
MNWLRAKLWAKNDNSCLLSYLLGRQRSGRSQFKANLGKKFMSPILTNSQAWCYVPVISRYEQRIDKRVEVQAHYP